MDSRIAAVRRFNRFYTARIGVLREGLLATPFSLTEARILYELGHREGLTASLLARELELDPGYVSRLLQGLARRGFIAKRRSDQDARQSLLALTAAGRRAFATLDTRSIDEVRSLLSTLVQPDQRRLVDAMRAIEDLLSERANERAPYLLRPHRPGDWGWIVSRHGSLYAEEFGWNIEFEALVAQIGHDFIANFKPGRECCWIAERSGVNVGSVALVEQSKTVAKLRVLLVESSARGLGIGARLVDECERFARQAGYKKIVLWTNSVLVAARGLYERAGYRLVSSEPHHSFGVDLVGEYWDKKL